MSQTTLQRNIDILLAFANGADTDALAKEHHFASRANIGGCVRDAMKMLKRYSGQEDLPDTSSFEILSKIKDRLAQIVKDTKIPKVPIAHRSHMFLSKHFGHNYPEKAKTVADNWDAVVDANLNRHHYKQERESIKKWLGSEGYFVDDYVDDDHLKQMQQALKLAFDKIDCPDVTLALEENH